jgi:hypothetical protein
MYPGSAKVCGKPGAALGKSRNPGGSYKTACWIFEENTEIVRPRTASENGKTAIKILFF